MPNKRASARKRNTWIILFLLTVIFLLAALSCVLMLQLNRERVGDVTGRWVMRLDLTDHARTCANLWLRGAELGDRIDVGDRLPTLSVNIVLSLNADGSWTRRIDTSDYSSAEKSADRALAQALLELLALRTEAAGRKAWTSDEAQTHLYEAVGLSAEEYLTQYGPSLLPDAGELEARYNGSGRWDISGQEIIFDGQRRAEYRMGGGVLILADGGEREVYERG